MNSQQPSSDSLSLEAIQAGLHTRIIGQSLLYLSTTGSTNDDARRLARVGAPDGTLVVADWQRAGRGRLARQWLAPAGSSLLLSVVLRPPLAPHQAQRLTMVCALAAADAIEAETGLRSGLKWPNDLLLGSAKVGGILTELELDGERLAYAIVGLGLNVNLEPAALPAGLVARATSLSAELGRPVARLPLLLALLTRLEARYVALGEDPGALQAEWAARLVTLGRDVTVGAGDAQWEGIAEGVDHDGALLVRRADGRLVRVVAGDVMLRA